MQDKFKGFGLTYCEYRHSSAGASLLYVRYRHVSGDPGIILGYGTKVFLASPPYTFTK